MSAGALSADERLGIEKALAELEFATEPGGGREGETDAEEAYRRLDALDLAAVSETVLLVYLDDLRLASTELCFSTEPGGALDGDEEAERGLKALERLIGRLETLERTAETSFAAEPRVRPSDLSDGLSV